jgi:lipopolysaccharide export system permease protein
MMAESGALISTPDGPRFLLINGNRQEVSTEGQAIKMLCFDRYTLDLSGLTDAPQDRYREPRERFFHELIGPSLSVSDDEHRGELNAEVHQRLVMPFNVVALTMIGLASMLSGEFNRRRQWPRLLAAALCATVFMSFSFAIGNALIKTPALAVVFYCYPVVTIALAASVLRSTRTPRWLRVPYITTAGS